MREAEKDCTKKRKIQFWMRATFKHKMKSDTQWNSHSPFWTNFYLPAKMNDFGFCCWKTRTAFKMCIWQCNKNNSEKTELSEEARNNRSNFERQQSDRRKNKQKRKKEMSTISGPNCTLMALNYFISMQFYLINVDLFCGYTEYTFFMRVKLSGKRNIHCVEWQQATSKRQTEVDKFCLSTKNALQLTEEIEYWVAVT